MDKFEKVTFKTEDGVGITANLNKIAGAEFYLLFVHMMPKTKESWADFQEESSKRGYGSLAIDLRGHGESTEGGAGKIDYRLFSDKDHQNQILDIEAAVLWLKKQGIKPENIFLIGASIGANLVIQYLAEHAEMRAVAALSPGLDYKGIITMPFAKALTRDQHLFLIASDDDQESFHSVQKLNEISLAKTKLKLLKSSGHGTNILDKQPALINEILDWMDAIKSKLNN